MKTLLFVIACILSLTNFCFSQYQLIELEKAKEIRILHADRDTVGSMLRDYKLDDTSDHSDDFSTADAAIEVSYSSDSCDEDDEDVIWDVPAGRVTRIEVVPEKEFKLEDLGIDPETLSKEQIYANVSDSFIYHDKRKGIAIKVDEGVVERFILFPPLSSKPKPCKNKTAKEFVSSKSWFGNSKLKDREVISCVPASVADLTLSVEELKELGISREVTVTVKATDPDNDVLTYLYTVSAGKVVGKGDNVVWDLRGVGLGSYTITAGVDDGCGLCGTTITKTVVIK